MLDTYFRNLLYVVHAGNSFFELVCIFILQKLKICMLFKGGVGWGGVSVHLRISLNLLKYIFFIYTVSVIYLEVFWAYHYLHNKWSWRDYDTTISTIIKYFSSFIG